MKVFICLAAVLCAVSAGYVAGPAAVVRAPQFDSAVIKSDRLGGNFAYSTAESHAYASVNPVVENVVAPVGVSYSAHTVTAPVAVAAPAVHAYAAPAVHAYAAPAVASYAHHVGAYAAPAVASYAHHVGAYAAPYAAHVASPYGYAAHYFRR